MLWTRAFGSARRHLVGCHGGIGRASYPAEHLLSDRLGGGRSTLGHSPRVTSDPFGARYRVPCLSTAPPFLGCGELELARFSRKLAPDLSAFGRTSPCHHFLGDAGRASASWHGLGSGFRARSRSWAHRYRRGRRDPGTISHPTPIKRDFAR